MADVTRLVQLGTAVTPGNVATWVDQNTIQDGGSPSGTGITQLTGDVTAGPGAGSQAATLATSGVSAATYGDGTHVPQIVVDAKGRITSASNVGVAGGLLDHVGVLDIVNTSSLTVLYTFSVPANTVGLTNHLNLRLVGDQLNNSGGSDTMSIRFQYGATTMYQGSAIWASNAARSFWWMDFTLGNNGATNSQYIVCANLNGSRVPGDAGHGTGDWNGNGFINNVLAGTAAEDSTTTLTFQVILQHSVANAATSWRRLGGWLSLT
jgi:hypothetical protein